MTSHSDSFFLFGFFFVFTMFFSLKPFKSHVTLFSWDTLHTLFDSGLCTSHAKKKMEEYSIISKPSNIVLLMGHLGSSL